ncbi:hypothetical protein T265_12217 [Opisthorchis viverrini]|uniref:Uncharacterized protein n=1 Tax=Opisthorchis viverrini TaxID=6198 RepID=A0A074YZH3_OPIVI|nr:hypothetical protein T265_12217 [Opisthorchis viverrini]KER18612.1 hypothetical protein T265_12217 [Opisthorchis viverrini]
MQYDESSNMCRGPPTKSNALSRESSLQDRWCRCNNGDLPVNTTDKQFARTLIDSFYWSNSILGTNFKSSQVSLMVGQ